MSLIRGLAFTGWLFLAFSVAPLRVKADAISTVSVRTDTTNLPGGSACSLSSSGAAIQCTSGETGVPVVAQASGSASAAFGLLTVATAADGPAPNPATPSAVAEANASYSYQVILPNAPPGEVIGFYHVTMGRTGNPLEQGTISITEGSASTTFPISDAGGPLPFLLMHPYVAGQPLDITASIQALALASGSMSATVQLVGFTDGTGAPIAFTIVPEPAGWPVLGLCLLVVWRAKGRLS